MVSKDAGVVQNPNPKKKSIVLAYVLWLFGGIFGLHHYYLGRDRHGFVWWTTLGGFGIGWLGEVLKVRKYVADANEDQKYMSELISKMQRNPKPPFSMNRFTGMLMVGYSWAYTASMAIPPEGFWFCERWLLNLLVLPLVASAGVWNVGNIGHEEGVLYWALIGAFLGYVLRNYIFDDTYFIMTVVATSALFFDCFSKRWKHRRNRRSVFNRMVIIGFCTCLYLSLWGSYLYHQGTITDSQGDEIPIYEAVQHFFTSPWWVDLHQCFMETYHYAQHHGWKEIFKQILEFSDPYGGQNAHAILGVHKDASQKEITARWRILSRQYHPDKVKDKNERRYAQERFMDVQLAYAMLSKSRNRRNRNNRRDNSPLNAS